MGSGLRFLDNSFRQSRSSSRIQVPPYWVQARQYRRCGSSSLGLDVKIQQMLARSREGSYSAQFKFPLPGSSKSTTSSCGSILEFKSNIDYRRSLCKFGKMTPGNASSVIKCNSSDLNGETNDLESVSEYELESS